MKTSWTVEFLNDAVEAEFLAIPKDIQSRLVRIAELIESHGLENLGMPYVRHLRTSFGRFAVKASQVSLAPCTSL